MKKLLLFCTAVLFIGTFDIKAQDICGIGQSRTYNLGAGPQYYYYIDGPSFTITSSAEPVTLGSYNIQDMSWTTQFFNYITAEDCGSPYSDGSITIRFNSAGVYTVKAAIYDCSWTLVNMEITETFTVYATTVGGSITGVSSECSGKPFTLSLSGHTGSVIKWQEKLNAGAWTDISNTTTSLIRTPAVGSWQYQAIVQNGTCASTTSSVKSVTVNSNPTASITPNPAIVCSGVDLTMNGNPAGGSTVWSTHAWSGSGIGAGFSSTSVQNPTFNKPTGSYSLTYIVTDNNGCTGTDSRTITVNPNPATGISAASEVCSGINLNMTGTPSGGSGTYSAHSWTGASGISQANQQNSVLNNSTPNTYTINYEVTDDKGCKGISNVSVTVLSNPTASINPNPANACAGINLNMFGIPAGGTGSYSTHAWTGTGLTVTNTQNTTFNYSTANTYTLTYTVTDNKGCKSAAATRDVVVNANPTASILPASASICAASTLSLDGNPSGGSGTFSTHAWTGSNLSATNIVNPTYTNNTAGSYSVTYTVTDNKGCTGSSTRSITVDAKSVGGSLSGGTAEICQTSNTGVITLSGNTGGVVKWQKSANAGVNWTDVTGTSTTLNEAINATGTYVFRAVVKNLTCDTAYSSNSISILVDAPSDGGTATSETKTASLGQPSTINLIGQSGTIQKWQWKTASATTWNDIVKTTAKLIDTATSADSIFYRAVVKNAVCPAANSVEDFVIVLNPLICVVRFDAETNKNKIVWERTGSNIKSYKIYSVNGTTYNLLATIPYEDYSQYIDVSSDPTSQRYTYSMSTVNSSDVESSKSNVHKTMLLTPNVSTVPTDANLIWQSYIDESGKIAPDSVFIYKGKTKDAMTLLKGLTYDNTVFIDHTFDGVSAYYQLRIKVPVCTPSGTMKAESGPYAQSLSNIVEYKASGLVQAGSIPTAVYPNPTNGIFNIEFELENAGDVTIEIISQVGSVEKIISLQDQNAGINTIQLNAKDCNMSPGVHVIKVVAGNKVAFVKLGFF